MPAGLVLGVVDRVQLVLSALGVVGDDDLERVEHRHAALRVTVEHLADVVLQARELHGGVGLGDTDGGGELADALCRVAAAPEAGDGGHARVIPATDAALFHEAQQEALRKDRPGQVEAGELVLVRHAGHGQVLDEPVVERTVVLELERADGVGDALDGVRLAVGEVVRGIDASRPRRCAGGWRARCDRGWDHAG